MTELEFFRLMRGMILPSDAHRAILKHVVVDNPAVENAQMFGLCYGAVSRVPMNRVARVTLRELQVEFNLPQECYYCVNPRAEGQGFEPGDGTAKLP